MKKDSIGITLLALFGIIVLIIAIHVGVTAVWNNIMPRIFGLPTISGWDLFGLMCIARWIIPTSSSSSKKDKWWD